MASKTLKLADTAPVNLLTELNLSAGDYVLSVDGKEAIRLYEADAAPSDRFGHLVLPGGTWAFTAATDPVWIWANAAGAVVVVSGS